jgi:hypothetical protein
MMRGETDTDTTMDDDDDDGAVIRLDRQGGKPQGVEANPNDKGAGASAADAPETPGEAARKKRRPPARIIAIVVFEKGPLRGLEY